EQPPGPPFPTGQVARGGSGYGTTKAALNRLTVAVAAELYEHGIAVNALAPQSAIATPQLLDRGGIPADHFEPMETMAEAVLALATADPARLTGRIAFSLALLIELDRSVYGLDGVDRVAGWQPPDLHSVIDRQADMREASGWTN